MKTNANDPISMGYTNDPNSLKNLGLTKREAFAMAAMQGLCVGKITRDIMSGQCLDIASEAVEIADCLIDALNAKEVSGE